MTNFDDIINQWNSQQEPKTPNNGSKEIIKKIKAIKTNQLIARIILGITVVILASFFIYIKAYKNTLLTIGLLLMIGSLALRITIEAISSKTLNTIKAKNDTQTFKNKMIAYYKKRINTHYIVTPIIAILYIIGYIILMPFFKEDLSQGFYMYTNISAIVALIVLTLFIRKQILNEINVLKELSS